MWYLLELHELSETEQLRLAVFVGEGEELSRGTNAMAKIVREVRTHDNLAAVCASQLQIDGLIDDAALSDAEALVVQTFVNVLTGIDRFDDAIEARRLTEIEEANRPAPRPVPIDETTMELTDGPMATWGNK